MKKMERLYDYLCKLNPYTPKDALLLTAIVKIAQVGGMNNLKVSSITINNPQNMAPANVYGLTFLDSGVGKDKPLREIDSNLLINVLADFKERCLKHKEQALASVEDRATKKFGEKRSAEKSKYINEHSPRFLPLEISDATLEGFMAARQAYQDAGFGGTFIKMSEFGDYIISDEGHRKTFIDNVVEVYDWGNSNPKYIKGDKNFEPVMGVTSSAVMHTSPAGLLEGENRKKIFGFFNRGIARRSFVCYPESVDIGTLDPEEMMRMTDASVSEAGELAPSIRADFDSFYYGTLTDTLTSIVSDTKVNVFTLTPDAVRVLKLYGIKNRIAVSKMPEDSDIIGLKSEKTGKDWRAMKLSALIAAFNHPDQKIVSVEDINEAIRITDIFSLQIEKFYKARPTDDIEKLYNYFIAHANEWVTTMDIRSVNIVHHNRFSRWFEEALDLVSDMIDKNGYILETGKNGRNGTKYRISKVVIPEIESKAITFSQASGNSRMETEFIPQTVSFDTFHTVALADRAWCATTFSQNYRKDENSTGKVSVIVLDIDEGMAMNDCKKTLKDVGVKALVYTTKSHGIAKDKKPACDRYRVVIPLCKEMAMDNDTHKRRLTAVSSVFGIPNDVSTRNIGRLWFGNTAGEYEYIDGGCLDLEKFDTFENKETPRNNSTKTNTQNIERWFVQNYKICGGRNNALYRASRFFYKDEGNSAEDTKDILIRINSSFDKPLEEKEMIQTIYKSFK